MPSDDLAAFLLARIAEDERRARSVRKVNSGIDGPTMPEIVWDGRGPSLVGRHGDWTRRLSDDEYAAMVEQCSTPAEPDPRVLAECEAKRRIVEAHEPMQYEGGSQPISTSPRTQWQWTLCSSCGDQGYNDFCGVEYPCLTLRLLGLPYTDHPDYHEEWRP